MVTISELFQQNDISWSEKVVSIIFPNITIKSELVVDSDVISHIRPDLIRHEQLLEEKYNEFQKEIDFLTEDQFLNHVRPTFEVAQDIASNLDPSFIIVTAFPQAVSLIVESAPNEFRTNHGFKKLVSHWLSTQQREDVLNYYNGREVDWDRFIEENQDDAVVKTITSKKDSSSIEEDIKVYFNNLKKEVFEEVSNKISSYHNALMSSELLLSTTFVNDCWQSKMSEFVKEAYIDFISILESTNLEIETYLMKYYSLNFLSNILFEAFEKNYADKLGDKAYEKGLTVAEEYRDVPEIEKEIERWLEADSNRIVQLYTGYVGHLENYLESI